MTTFRTLNASATDVVALGDGRFHVRDVLGEFRTFRRTPESAEADQFVETGAMATYSAEGSLILLELTTRPGSSSRGSSCWARNSTHCRRGWATRVSSSCSTTWGRRSRVCRSVSMRRAARSRASVSEATNSTMVLRSWPYAPRPRAWCTARCGETRRWTSCPTFVANAPCGCWSTTRTGLRRSTWS